MKSVFPVLKKLLKGFIIFLVFIFTAQYFIIRRPENLILETFEAAKIGDQIPSLFGQEKPFSQALSESHTKILTFSGGDGSLECGKVFFRDDEATFLNSGKVSAILWKGKLTRLGEALAKEKSTLVGCDKLCVTLMPVMFLSGSFCLNYDAQFIITGKKKPTILR